MAHEKGHRLRIVHGDARGADKMSESVAHELGIHRIGVYPAKWDEHGKAAGPIRNRQMLDEEDPDLVVAFHDRIEKSKGTKDMIFEANKRGLPVHLYSEREE